VRIARSVSCIASISPKRTPRERVVAAPITRNCDWPAIEPRPSSRSPSVPSKRRTRQAIFEVPISRMAITPRWIAARRMFRMALCDW
jgi:hypothetical protein